MRQKKLSYANRLWCCAAVMLVTISVDAQRIRSPQNRLDDFLETQFWLGLRFGINYAQADPQERYSGFSPINYDAETLEKTYTDYALAGAHAGLEMNFYHRGFSLSFQPAFKRNRFAYENALSWQGESANSRYETRYQAEQRLDVIELATMLKYDIIRRGKIRPFLMAGGFYNLIISAQKDVIISQVDYASGNAIGITGGVATYGVKDLFQNYAGLGAGGGVNLDYWNIRTVLELSFKQSMTSATLPGAQHLELAALGDANDELRLNDFNVSLSFVFPFRFIDKQFKAY